MTKKEKKYGCLSRSLTNFLNITPEERREKYGKNVSKYYERIRKEIKASFDDHTFAFANLPDEQAKQIDFRMYYDSMLQIVMRKKWVKEAPLDSIDEAVKYLGLAQGELYGDDHLFKIAGQDFERVSAWLGYLKRTKEPSKDYEGTHYLKESF